MNAENDLIKLYSGRILELASDIPRIGRLSDPTGTAKHRSPLCGSTVTVDVRTDDGKITDFAQDVKACALGQASAAVIGNAVIGLTLDEIIHGRDQLEAMLKNDGPVPDVPFDGLEVLLPARAYKNRHASILLTLNALAEAVDISENT